MFFKSRTAKISYLLAKAQFKRSLKPKITVSGDWLEMAGFKIGAEVEIQVYKNKLIIQPLQDGNTNNRA
ncbi:type I addiction module toxin, SymE family [Flavobacterium sp. LMO6]|uniref:Type I addiction module toxin SymE family n=1 Tax=Flavobacterium phage vB_FspS_laban6-1 TaxID=2686250 RepID=A0A6B9LAN1_9CAUD|nr:SymE family type I addiction module toxin [Flavobacterium sp. LMO6]YP_009854823.1 SymE family type I addiction module toxin [Flavobacterium phage vB_FspS_laban6-1]MQP63352.1 type I addiction module toxin, SymE family [Flavobacterium sp. LMO6]QHB38996.1 type I addiction module toxin SymE family [Flavobacterium phage vB_FspS_laban6-1]